MALEELKAQIAMLMARLEEDPKDAHELYELVREKLEQMKAMGLPLPADLVGLEKNLEREFAARAAKPAKKRRKSPN
jgi:hypothetical protein